VLAVAFGSIHEWEITSEDVLLHPTPLPHGAGFMAFAGLVRGCKNVIIRGFDAHGFVEQVRLHGGTWTFLVPTMLYRILDCGLAGEYAASSLRTVLYGAAPIDPLRLAQACRTIGAIFIQSYAQMEAVVVGTLLTKADHQRGLTEPNLLRSCGRQAIGVDIAIVDEAGLPVANGQVGELTVAGPHVMRGYWRADSSTEGTLRGGGLLHTGDLAYRDDAGYLYIVDRKKDMIVSGGMNVYSATVEAALGTYPGIKAAAVIGRADPVWGEAVAAFVTVDDEIDPPSADELRAHAKSVLASYEVPKSFTILPQMPLTAYGKIDKKALRSMEFEQAPEQGVTGR
jgi:acyl-CoA synthetase (AMP-forming)/AMP-acid ligase II